MSPAAGRTLSAFACELLRRSHELLGGAAFGRLTQELVVSSLRTLHPALHENPGAGTPDCRCSEPGAEWAWEVKYGDGNGIELGQRDLDGLRVGDGPTARPRVIVLDIRFPARVWVLDATGLEDGPLIPEAVAGRQRTEEAEPLVEALERLLRVCDVDLLVAEVDAKNVAREASASFARSA